jgi:hypothetical protein
MSEQLNVVYCQQCRARNDADDKYCHKCNARLMVVNWAEEVEDTLLEPSFFDEHILERISALEENVRILSERLALIQQAMIGASRDPEDGDHDDD